MWSKIEKNQNLINGGNHPIVIKEPEDVTISDNTFKKIDCQPIVIWASIRLKAYNNEVGQPIGKKLVPPVLINLN